MTSIPSVGKSFRFKKNRPIVLPSFAHFEHMNQAFFTITQIIGDLHRDKYIDIQLQCNICNTYCIIDSDQIYDYFYQTDGLKIKETPTYLEL